MEPQADKMPRTDGERNGLDGRSFARGLFSRGFGTIFQVSVGVITLAVVARVITKNEFGVFALINVVVSFLQMAGSLVLQGLSVTKFIAGAKEEETGEIVSTAITSTVYIFLALGSLCLFLGLAVRAFMKTPFPVTFIAAVLVLFGLVLIEQLLLKILQGFKKYGKMAMAQVLTSCLRVTLVLFILLVLRWGFWGLMLASVLAAAGGIVYSFRALGMRAGFHVDRELLRRMFRFGYPLGLNEILTFVFMKADRMLVGGLIGPVQVANYEVATRLPDTGRNLYGAFGEVYFPNMVELIAEKDSGNAEKLLNHSLRGIGFLCLLATLISAVFAKEIISILFSSKYLESAPGLYLMMFALAINLSANVMGLTLVAAGQSDKPAKVNVVRASINLAGSLILIPRFGYLGAVYATIVSSLIANPLNIWFLKRAAIRVEPVDYLKPLIIFLGCWIPFAVFGWTAMTPRIAVVAGFLALCGFASVIRKQDLSILLDMIRRPKAAGIAEQHP